jgi:hypothetical protein
VLLDEGRLAGEGAGERRAALSRRHGRSEFRHYEVEYTFADGAKLFFTGRCIDGCANQFASYAHGSKACAQISANGHTPARCKIWRGQDMTSTPIWSFAGREPNPYQSSGIT